MTTSHSRERFAPSFPFDFAAYDRAGRRTAIVEAKRRFGTNSRWAAEYWRNLREHRSIPNTDFFALIMPDRLYVWRASEPSGAPPVEVNVGPVFAPYFERAGVRPEQIESMAFEIMVSWWLNDLARQGSEAFALPELSKSGLPEAIAGTQIVHEAGV